MSMIHISYEEFTDSETKGETSGQSFELNVTLLNTKPYHKSFSLVVDPLFPIILSL